MLCLQLDVNFEVLRYVHSWLANGECLLCYVVMELQLNTSVRKAAFGNLRWLGREAKHDHSFNFIIRDASVSGRRAVEGAVLGSENKSQYHIHFMCTQKVERIIEVPDTEEK